ncbi:MAG TPA: hypothetical protein VGR03_10490 [Candidatus Acidoferrum sp.]|nr:hypothetical protein [Candidatus Acidoferrum sp.]
MKDSVRPPTRGKSVKDDWRAWLPEEKAQVFLKQVQQLESGYAMLSVSLDEALELKHLGHSGKSLQAMGITSGLCRLLTQTLAGLLRALSEHSKHFGTIPNTAPLDPANFQGQRGQRSARMSSLLSHVLLSHRLQFLHKVSTLEEMVEDLGKDFRYAADDLAEGAPLNPKRMWDEVDADHYDLNTCLREAIVVFKSFLIALPESQLGAFQNTVRQQTELREVDVPSRHRLIRHRRMTAIAGE